MSTRRVGALGGAALVVALLATGIGLVRGPARDLAVYSVALGSLSRSEVSARDLDPEPESGPAYFLVVGSDQRHVPVGATRDIRGERADAIMLWAVDERSLRVLSIPRDVRVHVPGHGDGKLGGTLAYGAAALVAAVRSLLGTPVHHYVEVEFPALTSAVDRVGGLELDLAHPVRDLHSGLSLPSGRQTVRGAQSLAFVRSRTFEELVDGRWVLDPAGDLGRVRRQQVLLGELMASLRRCGGLDCVRLLSAVGSSVAVDRAFAADDLRRVDVAAVRASAAGAAGLWAHTVPTTPARDPRDSLSPFPPSHLGNVGYLLVDHPATAALVRRLGSPDGR